ncbi:MAG: ferrochelatase [Proteobacteria bacterium]|nr:ferrochelatase [Pseudomonadota bacterium]
MSKAVLLLNLGTPAQPTAKGLREFYRYFFADPFVFDMNPLGRWLLRNLIIMPFRAPKASKEWLRSSIVPGATRSQDRVRCGTWSGKLGVSEPPSSLCCKRLHQG